MHYERFSFPTSPCQLLPTNQSLLLHFNIFPHPPLSFRLTPPPHQKKKSSKMYHDYQSPLPGHFGHPHIPSLLTPPFSQQNVTNTNNAPTRGRFWTHPFPLSIYYLAYSIYTHQYQPLTTFHYFFHYHYYFHYYYYYYYYYHLFSHLNCHYRLSIYYLSTHLSIYLSTNLSISDHRVPAFRSCTRAVTRAFCFCHCRLHRIARMKVALA